MSLVRVQHQEPRSLAAVSWGHSQAKAGLCKGSALILLVSQVRVVGKGTRNRKAGFNAVFAALLQRLRALEHEWEHGLVLLHG